MPPVSGSSGPVGTASLSQVIDIKALREDPERVRRSQQARGEDDGIVDVILALDERRRSSLSRYEALRAQQKLRSKEVGELMGKLARASRSSSSSTVVGLADEAEAARAEASALSEEVKKLEVTAADSTRELDAALRRVGNVIIDGVPWGGEEDYVVLATYGEPRATGGAATDSPGGADGADSADGPDRAAAGVRDHVDILEGLGGLDLARGVKVAESRFYYLVGQGARLESALMNLALARAYQWGFTQLSVPTLVNPMVMGGAGFLDAHADEVYRLGTDDLYLTGTSEVALAGYHADEILDLSDGPRRYTASSTCYRREAGSYGKDTRGIIRVHQFQKVEMFIYCREEDAVAEHERLLSFEKEMLDLMEIPYRVIDVAAGDLGGPAARKYDCEAWVPSQGRYRELTSTSNCTTFQARRLGIRERAEKGTRAVATLNGTLATSRWLVALVENHQQPDGSVLVPAALQPYLGTDRLVPGGR